MADSASARDVLGEVVLKFHPSAVGVMLEGAASVVFQRVPLQPPITEHLLPFRREGRSTAKVKVGENISLVVFRVEFRDKDHGWKALPAMPVSERGLERLNRLAQSRPRPDAIGGGWIECSHCLPVLAVCGGP